MGRSPALLPTLAWTLISGARTRLAQRGGGATPRHWRLVGKSRRSRPVQVPRSRTARRGARHRPGQDAGWGRWLAAETRRCCRWRCAAPSRGSTSAAAAEVDQGGLDALIGQPLQQCRATNSGPLSPPRCGLGAIPSERDIHAPVLRLSVGRVVRCNGLRLAETLSR